MCLSKYVAVYVSMYAGLCHALRRRLRLLLNLTFDLNLNLNLNLALSLTLFGKSLEKTFERSNPLSFRPSLDSRNRSSLVLACLQPRRQTLPPGQSLGRPLGGRIVVQLARDYYI